MISVKVQNSKKNDPNRDLRLYIIFHITGQRLFIPRDAAGTTESLCSQWRIAGWIFRPQSDRNHFARIQNILRVKRLFDAAHDNFFRF